MLRGIDVSHWDGAIDWARVASAGYSFAWCKATQGVDKRDATYRRNIAEAMGAGLMAGSYHYFDPHSEGAAQAEWFLQNVGDLTGQLLPVVDVEERAKLDRAELSAGVRAWLSTVEAATGVKPIVYSYWAFIRQSLDRTLGSYPLWLAKYSSATPAGPIGGWSDWVWWQHSSTGPVPGVPEANCDKDVFRGTLADLHAYIIGAEAGPMEIVLLPGSAVIDCHPAVEAGTTRCDLRALAEALGYEVHAELLQQQNKLYLRPKGTPTAPAPPAEKED